MDEKSEIREEAVGVVSLTGILNLNNGVQTYGHIRQSSSRLFSAGCNSSYNFQVNIFDHDLLLIPTHSLVNGSRRRAREAASVSTTR